MTAPAEQMNAAAAPPKPYQGPVEMSPEIGELAKALAAAQLEMVNPVCDGDADFATKNGGRKSYKYASLAAVRDATIKPAAKHGIAVVQTPRQMEDGVVVTTMLIHGGTGQWLASRLYLPVNDRTTQGYGSAITYARRYSLMSIFGIAADEDDDAVAAGTEEREQRKPGNGYSAPPAPNGNGKANGNGKNGKAAQPDQSPPMPAAELEAKMVAATSAVELAKLYPECAKYPKGSKERTRLSQVDEFMLGKFAQEAAS